MATDQEAFSGADGSRLEQIAARLSAGNTSLAGTQIVVRPGIEVRASGDLTVSADWSLPSAASVRASAPHAGDTSLTIRSAGALNIAASVSTGFAAPEGFDPSDSIASSDRSGSLSFVSGADLSAAGTRQTLANPAADLTLGNDNAAVTLRTTTGDIGLHSGADIVWVNNRATVYSAGKPVQLPLALDALVNDLPSALLQGGGASPMLSGGGAVTLTATNDVLGVAVSPDRPSITDWWWRSSTSQGGLPMWWSRIDLFDQGVGSFGGGAVDVSAGRDVVNLHVSAASNGLLGEPGAAPLLLQGGGALEVRAGRDLVNGALYAGGETLDVNAGRAILRDTTRSNEGDPGLQVVHEQTAVRVQAVGGITLASVRNAGLMMPASDPTGTNPTGLDAVISGRQDGARLSVNSAAGSIDYAGTAQPVSPRVGSLTEGYAALGNLLPGSVSFTAPDGGVTLGGQLVLLPSLDGELQVLARDTVTLTGGLVVAAARGPHPPALQSLGEASSTLAVLVASGLDEGGRLDGGGRSPVRIVSEAGDVQITGQLRSVRPVRLLAGEDLTLGAGGRIVLQHQPNPGAPSELSLLRAGRDYAASTTSGISGVAIGGPGDLVLIAGRDVDFGASRGITATGNRDASTVLPVGAASVNVVAGVRAEGRDYRRAAREGYALLGPAALAAQAGDLYALLQSGAASGSEVARAFEAATSAGQLQQVRELLGEARFEAGAIAFVRSLPKQSGTEDAQALKALGELPEGTRRLAAGVLLTRAFGELSAPDRSAFLAALALRDASPAAEANRKAFNAFMVSASGTAPASLQQGLAAFEQLPLERQALWLNQALVKQVRLYGRQAALRGGAERTDAYTRAYLAIDALFPWAEGEAGDIRLPTSQIRTVQQADITLLSPRGGVNAGELVGGSSTRAADLGIVTVGGGNISAIVRDSFEVNQSRVFSLQRGDILMWASEGNIDAGRGAKTVTGAPAPVLRLDSEGRLTLDTSGSFSGSGIAVLDAQSALDLYAPQGEINAGEAGIKSLGTAFFGAQTFRGTDDIKVSGAVVGAPPPPPSSASLDGLSTQTATNSGTTAATEESEEEKRKKRRARRNLLIDFLGFGPERG